MKMTNQLLDAFREFNDAAYAIGHYQLSQATTAADRLEKARSAFQILFKQAIRDEPVAGRSDV